MPGASERAGLRALIVENDTSNRELLARVLRLRECQTDTAVGAQQGMALLREQPERYDLLITDLKMEPIDGVELLRQIEGAPAERRPRALVVLSGYLNEYYDKLSQLHLPLEIFQKPIHLPSLMNILDRLRDGEKMTR
jgi:CheY-like chemotaxis protein